MLSKDGGAPRTTEIEIEEFVIPRTSTAHTMGIKNAVRKIGLGTNITSGKFAVWTAYGFP